MLTLKAVHYGYCWLLTVWKVSKYGVFSGPYFPVYVLNTEIYGVNLRIQSEYGKIRTRKHFIFGHFSRTDCDEAIIVRLLQCYCKAPVTSKLSLTNQNAILFVIFLWSLAILFNNLNNNFWIVSVCCKRFNFQRLK